MVADAYRENSEPEIIPRPRWWKRTDWYTVGFCTFGFGGAMLPSAVVASLLHACAIAPIACVDRFDLRRPTDPEVRCGDGTHLVAEKITDELFSVKCLCGPDGVR